MIAAATAAGTPARPSASVRRAATGMREFKHVEGLPPLAA